MVYPRMLKKGENAGCYGVHSAFAPTRCGEREGMCAKFRSIGNKKIRIATFNGKWISLRVLHRSGEMKRAYVTYEGLTGGQSR